MNAQRQLIGLFLLRQKRGVLLAVLLGMANSTLTLLLPLSLGRFYEQLFGGVSNRGQALDLLGLGHIGGNDWTAFFGLFGGLVLLRGLAEWAEFRATGRIGEAFVRHLREQTVNHHLALPVGVHRQKPVGKYLLRYGSDFGSLLRYLTQGLIGFTKDVLFLVLAGGLLCWLNPLLTGIVVASLLPFLLVFRLLNNRLEKATAHRRDLRSGYLNHVATRLAALETIKVFNRETIENEQFSKRSASLSAANDVAMHWRSILTGLLPTAVYAMVFAVLVGIHTLVPSGISRGNGGVIITFILLILSLRPVLRRLLRVSTVWRSGRLSLSKLSEFMSQPIEQERLRPALTVTEGRVQFNEVSFAYSSGQSALSDFSLLAEAGTITPMSGGPGRGKTTAFNLLLGLYNPDAGTILIDGQDIAHCSVASVRKQVTLVSAEVPLLGRTVFEAVSYSRKANKRPAADAMLYTVQKLAQIPGPLTLDDQIGEQGRTLSEGQRSVLRLVRGLLTRKRILLLDEPFTGISDAGVTGLLDWLDTRHTDKTILIASSRAIRQLSLCHELPD